MGQVATRTNATGVKKQEAARRFCQACATTLNGDDVSNPDAIVCNGKKSALVYNLVGTREVIITESVEPITEINHLEQMGFVEVEESVISGKEFPLPMEAIAQLIRLGAKVASQLSVRWFVSMEWLAPLQSDGRFLNRFLDFVRNDKIKRFTGTVYAVYGNAIICLRCIKRIREKEFFCSLTATEEQMMDCIRSH